MSAVVVRSSEYCPHLDPSHLRTVMSREAGKGVESIGAGRAKLVYCLIICIDENDAVFHLRRNSMVLSDADKKVASNGMKVEICVAIIGRLC